MISKKLIKKIIKYSIGGGVAALIDLSLLWVFTEYFGIYYLVSAIISFMIALTIGFFYQKYITFESNNEKHIVEGTYFFIFQSVGLVLNIFLLWLLSGILGFDYMLVAVLNKGLIFIWNFFMNYFFNFNH